MNDRGERESKAVPQVRAGEVGEGTQRRVGRGGNERGARGGLFSEWFAFDSLGDISSRLPPSGSILPVCGAVMSPFGNQRRSYHSLRK